MNSVSYALIYDPLYLCKTDNIREFANYENKQKHKHKRKISIRNQHSMTSFEYSNVSSRYVNFHIVLKACLNLSR